MPVPARATGNIGVGMVTAAFGRFNFIYRDQPAQDVGIDGHVEIFDGTKATGRLLAVQIKAGASYLERRDGDAYIVRLETAHVDYWLRYPLPVVLTLCDVENNVVYWAAVSLDTLTRTGESYTLRVPTSQTVDEANADALNALTEGHPADNRLARLMADREKISFLAEHRDRSLVVEVDEWIHKSSGRGTFRISTNDGSGNETLLEEFDLFAPGYEYEELFAVLFPWATIEVDEDYYEQPERDQFELDHGVWDSEDKEYFIDEDDYNEWKSRLPKIRPYGNSMGEVDQYRLLLRLNDLGAAFATVSAYLNQP